MRSRSRSRADLHVSAVPDGVRIRDRYGVRDPVVLDPGSHRAWLGLSRGEPRAALRRQLQREHGLRLSDAELTAFEAQLGAQALLEGPEAQGDRAAAFARAREGGALCLPPEDEPTRLALRCRALLEQAGERLRQRYGALPSRARVTGLLSPHGDLEATGALGALGYALLGPANWPDVFLVLGTSHYSPHPAVLTLDVRTALGRVETDREVVAALRQTAAGRALAVDPPELLIEHSWSRDLPLLQTAAQAAGAAPRIVALLTGSLSASQGAALGAALAQVLFDQRKHGCLVASGDLTHFGNGYLWRPPSHLRPERATVEEVVERLAAFEAKALEALCRRDGAAFARAVARTSFCARAQVSALIAFADGPGELLGRGSVINGVPHAAPQARRWSSQDALFNAASVAFARGWPAPPAAGPPLPAACPELHARAEGDEVALVHRCDHSARRLSGAAFAVVGALTGGPYDAQGLSQRLAGQGMAFSPEELSAFCGTLAGDGLVHPAAPPSPEPHPWHWQRAEQVLRRARAEVPAYAGYPAALADAPVLDRVRLAAQPDSFFAGGRPPRGGKLYRRSSSASSGGLPVVTVLPRGVMDERDFGALLVRPEQGIERVAFLSRPANLGFAWRGRLRQERVGNALRLAPGPDPSTVPDEVWDRVIDALARFRPHRLHGDPPFLAALARRSARVGFRAPSLVDVEAGHGYAWTLYLDAVLRAFAVPIHRVYHCSEVGTVGVTCARAQLHLLETHVLYELRAGGRQADVGELAQVVLTTLDSPGRPLIRYPLGDWVRLRAAACPCGRPFRVVSYEGRVGQLPRARGALVTLSELDAAVGAPVGLDHFQLDLRGPKARLKVRGPLRGEPLQALTERLSELLARPVRAERRALEVPERGKLHGLLAAPAR